MKSAPIIFFTNLIKRLKPTIMWLMSSISVDKHLTISMFLSNPLIVIAHAATCNYRLSQRLFRASFS